MVLLVFNPEHDLCLANGGPDFVPPRSALRLAESLCHCMLKLYPAHGNVACAAHKVAEVVAEKGLPDSLQVWGWNAMLKRQLAKQGIPERLMPSDEAIAAIRRLQHRSTLLPLQPQTVAAYTLGDVQHMLAEYNDIVLKAPWSGAGRGLRWASHRLSAHDELWIKKTIAHQSCVIAEPRRSIAVEFALEYMVANGSPQFIGYSLFQASNGVYTNNILLPDSEIASRLGSSASWARSVVEPWLQATVAPHYTGPIGVDCYIDTHGQPYVSEHNLRHTMGMVAHASL